MTAKPYLSLVALCEAYLEEFGDTFQGVGWTKRPEFADRRYRIMLDVIPPEPRTPVTLLDFGCGASHMYEYIVRHGVANVEYAGLDLSPKFLELSRRKHPHNTYYQLDILEDASPLPMFDYVVLNGIFNSRCDMAYSEMLEYWQRLVSAAFTKTRAALAFNVMSTQVDWERPDLFHLPFDVAAAFVSEGMSRRFVIRHDYGLYEYTMYVYRESTDFG
jgi:SAM-dependent methyltransferase